jgi:branched-subunit amino acid aminotransferase/4-amino-4-deoxychorismate lyase
MPAEERVLWPADLHQASEVILCSSVRELLPIVRLDDEPIRDGRVGPAYKALHELFRARVQRDIGRT